MFTDKNKGMSLSVYYIKFSVTEFAILKSVTMYKETGLLIVPFKPEHFIILIFVVILLQFILFL